MNQETSFINNIDKVVSSSDDLIQVAEDLAEVEILKSNDLTINLQILADYVSEFQFDWEEEAFYEKEYGDKSEKKRFASETVAKIKQMLADIKSGNQYKRIFGAELAYSRLDGDNYSYKVVAEKMMAKTVDEAIKEKDEIRSKASKEYPDDSSYALEDVRVRVKIVDRNNNTVLEEKFLLN